MPQLLLDAGAPVAGRPTVVAYPPAGSGTEYFHDWIPLVSPELNLLPVRLPGRQDLWDRAPAEDLGEITGLLAEEIAQRPDTELILLGICTGGLMAYDLAHRLRERRAGNVRALVLNGTPLPETAAGGLVRRYDAEQPFLWQAASKVLRDYYDTAESGEFPAEEASGDEDGDEAWQAVLMDEVWQLAEPRIRADIRATEIHSYASQPLDAPIVTIRGEADDVVPLEEAQGWAAHTRGRFTLRQLTGGHFLMADRKAEFARELLAVGRALGGPAGS